MLIRHFGLDLRIDFNDQSIRREPPERQPRKKWFILMNIFDLYVDELRSILMKCLKRSGREIATSTLMGGVIRTGLFHACLWVRMSFYPLQMVSLMTLN